MWKKISGKGYENLHFAAAFTQKTFLERLPITKYIIYTYVYEEQCAWYYDKIYISLFYNEIYVYLIECVCEGAWVCFFSYEGVNTIIHVI